MSLLRPIHRLADRLAEARWRLVQRLETDLHQLRYLFWEATRRCNLACRHCGSDCGRDESEPGLPGSVVLTALGSLARHQDARRIMLVVTGGEPLLRDDLEEVMEQAAGLGFRLGMVTNGQALDGPRARRLAALPLRSVVVSLDGPQECHEWLRRKPGSFDRACAALVALREAGVPIVEGITCVTPRSLDRLDETFALLRQLGATHWRIFNIFPAGRARGNPELLLDAPGIARLVREVARLRELGRTCGLTVNLSEEGYLGWEWEGRVRDTPYFCRAGINIAGILADGGIAACPNLPRWMVQGNLARDDLAETWERRYELFRDRSWTKRGPCGRCARWSVCQGNSLHLWDEQRQGPCWCHFQILHGEGEGGGWHEDEGDEHGTIR